MTISEAPFAQPHCDRPPRGWRCWQPVDHDGPCPAWPAWWNLKWKYRMALWRMR